MKKFRFKIHTVLLLAVPETVSLDGCLRICKQTIIIYSEYNEYAKPQALLLGGRYNYEIFLLI